MASNSSWASEPKHHAALSRDEVRELNYTKTRAERWLNLLPLMLQKWSATALWDERGNGWELTGGAGGAESAGKPEAKPVFGAAHTHGSLRLDPSAVHIRFGYFVGSSWGQENEWERAEELAFVTAAANSGAVLTWSSDSYVVLL